MKKQYIISVAAFVLVILLFFFGRTTEDKKRVVVNDKKADNFPISIDELINKEKENLTTPQQLSVSELENSVKRGDVHSQKLKAYNSLAAYWKDSVQSRFPYLYYTAEVAKLDNSEKNLTFAAQLILNNLRGEADEEKLKWETNEAITLFEEAIKLNPDNDVLKIGLGSCYVYGKGRNGNPQETMQGIQLLLGVVRKDSTNMKAQLVLGIGGFISGQHDKAIERLSKVVSKEPNNLEAIAFLADSYAAKGNNEMAIKWYNLSKRLANNAHYTKEVDERIKLLK